MNEKIEQVKLLLAYKRTAYSLFRTGVAVISIGMAIYGFLIVTRGHYDLFATIHLPVIFISTFLILFGGYIMIKSYNQSKKYSRKIDLIFRRNPELKRIIE